MTDHKREATFHPGKASVSWPETLAAHGYRAEEVPPPDDEIPWHSPGRPPWDSQVHQDLGVQHGWLTPGEKRKGMPAWAWVSIVLGGLFILCSGAVVLGLTDKSGPVPAITVPVGASVTTTGTCEKKIIGEYGLVATVTATNTSTKPQTGQVWVQWPVTGEAALKFSKSVTLAPGEAVEFPVNQEITAERWYRVGACSYGWAPA
jgi:hypothetical protein